MTTLAIIHTAPATIEPLRALAEEVLPAVTVINFVDDSILPQLAANGGDLSAVRDRLVAYAQFAERAGAAVILSACSSVGEAVAQMRDSVSIPVVRIDEPMADAAVQRGPRVGVAATVRTTLEPTMRLLRARAVARRVSLELLPCLVEGAFQILAAGDRAGHDERVAGALAKLAASADVVVLAQASMARVLPRLPDDLRTRVLSSPRLGMEAVRAALEGAAP
jgi:Asp/Glu/hydantoin racemase